MANRHLPFSITLALAALAGIATVASPTASGADSARLAPPVRPHLLTAYHPRPTSQLNPNSDLGLNFWSAMQNRPSAQPFAVTLSSKFSSVGPASIYTGASGQNYSGRIVAIAAHPTDANTLYIAAAGGGVWKTTNGGTSWTALTNGLPWQAMGSITIDPSNPDNVYAGTGETNNSGDSEYGIGLYKSTNAGSSWTLIQGNSGTNEFYRQVISKIVVDPNSSDTIYMAVEGATQPTQSTAPPASTNPPTAAIPGPTPPPISPTMIIRPISNGATLSWIPPTIKSSTRRRATSAAARPTASTKPLTAAPPGRCKPARRTTVATVTSDASPCRSRACSPPIPA